MSTETEYIAILPKGIDTEQKYLRLPHPRTGAPQLYLPTASGICEVVKVAGAKGRTWFIGDDRLADGAMLVHCPVDPYFLAIPVALSLFSDGRPAQFQPLSDLLATAAGNAAFALKPAFAPTADVEVYNADMGRLIEHKGFRAAFRACCEKKLIGTAPPSPPPENASSPPRQEAYYRPSREAILAVLRRKVDALASPDNFYKFDHLLRALGRDGLLEPGVDEQLIHAARIRASVEQIAQYLAPALLPFLLQCYDTLKLDAYLEDRAAAARAAAAPIVQTSSKEKGAAKRKAGQSSRGVEALKKVKTEGMAKMTSFFKPKAK